MFTLCYLCTGLAQRGRRWEHRLAGDWETDASRMPKEGTTSIGFGCVYRAHVIDRAFFPHTDRHTHTNTRAL